MDERLVGVAFLDVGVYVTTLRAVKNLLIIGDAVKSLWFVAFQVSNLKSSHQLELNGMHCRRTHISSRFWLGMNKTCA